MAENGTRQEPQRKGHGFLFPFALCLFPFLLLSTLNSAGYRYGASDLAFYIPAALERLDPGLFPRDGALIASQARLTLIDEVIAGLARTTGLALPALFATLYCVTLSLLLAAAWLIGERLYRSWWTTAVLVAALTLRHAIARSGTNTLEGYFHPRQLAFSLGALAIAALLRHRVVAAALLVLAGGLLHPTTAAWFTVWMAVAVYVNEPRWRRAILVGACGGVAGVVWVTRRRSIGWPAGDYGPRVAGQPRNQGLPLSTRMARLRLAPQPDVRAVGTLDLSSPAGRWRHH